MSDTPLAPVPDEIQALEARIVASILGDASAFEEADLDRLCHERPELQIFRRRLTALHELLAEAEAASPHPDWQLPPAKRGAIEGLASPLSAAEPAVPVLIPARRGRRTFHWLLPALAACLVLGFVFYSVFAGLGGKSILAHKSMRADSASEMVALQPDYPPELIEGTPQPMNLPERTPGSRRSLEIQGGSSSNLAPPDGGRISRNFYNTEFEKRPNAEVAARHAAAAPPTSSARAIPADALASRAPSREHPQPLSAPAQPSAPPAAPPPAGAVGGGSALGLDRSLATADEEGLTRGDRRRSLERGEANELDLFSLADAKPAAAKEMAETHRDSGAAPGEPVADGRLALRSEAEPPPPPADGQQAAHGYAWSGQKPPADPGLPTLSTPAKEDQGKLAFRYSDAETTGNTPEDAPALGGFFYRPAGSAGESKKAETATATAEARDLDADGATAKLGEEIRTQEEIVRQERAALGQIEKAQADRDSRKAQAVMDSISRAEYDDAKTRVTHHESRLLELKSKLAEVEGHKKVVQPAKPAPPVSSNETSAADDPFSTFSLNISDASFRTAYAALAAGRRPDPADILPEQFYNAFDYGDPYPSANEAMAARIEQCVHPVLPGRQLVRVALRTAASGRAASQPLHLTLLIDQSGSMARADRRAAVAHALGQIASLLGPQDRVTAIGFSLGQRLLADSVPGDQAAKIPGLATQDAIEGGTHLQNALTAAKDIATARLDGKARGRIVLLTDGAANLGSADPAALANIVRDMRAAGLAFDVAGIGTNELNDRLLAELARHGNGRFHVVAADDGGDELARQLAGAFRPAAENVKVQVRFNPSRVGSYRLIGFEKDRLKTEDFRNDAVDAAEMAAEEAGVAIYQVEVLHDGVGGLGEVSTRFRDTASDRMIEESWAIPYLAGAPAIDHASPSMQLAGLAVLCAEKLAGGPAAALIDLGDFKAVTANLRHHFPTSPRVHQLLEMADKLR